MPFPLMLQMQKAGCINNLEVKIESIDHQNVHIMMLTNIVIYAYKMSLVLFWKYFTCKCVFQNVSMNGNLRS